MDWEKLLKRYVWNDDKTPYLVAVSRLTRRQARSELFVYTLFVGLVFAVVAVASATGGMPHGRSAVVGLYAFSVVCAAVLLGFTRAPVFGRYLLFTPVAALLYLAVFGFHDRHIDLDKAVIVLLILAWGGYSLRVRALLGAYPTLPE